jgi:signal peptidase I
MSVTHVHDSLPRREQLANVISRGRQLGWSVLVPGVMTALAFRYLVPTRMSGVTGGATQAFAKFSSENPLIVILAIFIALSSAIHYWRERVYGPAVSLRPSAWTRARFGAVLALTVASALFLRVFVGETYRVTSSSMLPGLAVGDRLLVAKSSYGLKLPGVARRLGETTPKRGDVVVFTGDSPTGQGKAMLVKRVMGVPGDTVVFTNGQPMINGWIVPSCDAGPYVNFTKHLTVRGRLTVEFLDNQAYLTVRTVGEKGSSQYTVPPGEVFVVGDDRGLSSDSRVWNEGRGAGVPLADIAGRVKRVLVGGRPDGRLDPSRLFQRLGLDFYQPGVDLTKAKEWIENCLKDAPPSVPPDKSRFHL